MMTTIPLGTPQWTIKGRTQIATASKMDRVWIDDQPHVTCCVVDSDAVELATSDPVWSRTVRHRSSFGLCDR